MTRIRVAEELDKLKDFQRETVDHVFRRMYLDENPTTRFLVADEVGLGKTMVARGVVARAVAHLKSRVERVDIIYVCSNAAIAAQNIQRLNLLGDQEVAFATRLTLLPARVHELAKNRVNFVSFTPAVALDVKSRGGTKEERVILHSILSAGGQRGSTSTALANLLQASAGKEGWKQSLENAPTTLDPTLTAAFLKALKADRGLSQRLEAALERFAYYRAEVAQEDRELRFAVIGELRHLLARTCIDALEPDLVILDEFQRFSDIMHGDDDTAELAKLLFEYKDVRVLLLSATPYKMLTLGGADSDEHHFRDFLATTRFLLRNDEDKVKALGEALHALRHGLRGVGTGGLQSTWEARERVEAILRSVMSRMERISSTSARDALVVEPQQEPTVVREDVRQAVFTEQVSRALGAGDSIEYWKSAPYLLSFMRDYELSRRLRGAGRREERAVAELLAKNEDCSIHKGDIDAYREVPFANGRLRSLARDTLDRGLWRLLWLPPAVRYVAPEGAWAEAGDVTKALVFSAWNVVPDAIAGLLSYEAERRMVGATKRRYDTPQKALLTFGLARQRPAGMTSLLLHYPCLLLAEHFDPLRLAIELGGGRPVPIAELRERIRDKLGPLLKGLRSSTPLSEDGVDTRWYWAAPVMLDRRYPGVSGWLEADFVAVYDREDDDGEDTDGESGFEAHVTELRKAATGELALGAFPEDLADVLADLALGSPAVCAARALRRLAPSLAGDEPDILGGAARVAKGFRTLFNLPETMSLVRGRGDDEGEAYWRRVLEYGAEGDLQAVLDEYAHYLRDDLGLVGADQEKRVEKVAEAMAQAVSLRTTTVVAYDLEAEGERVKRNEEIRLRSRFAVRFGAMRDESDQSVNRADDVRRAFNSPFRPFVLASTSVGQEGLDFHPYCHAVVHWNLPSNPVDLEQREGRVHRYKGHAIRRNVAKAYGLPALSQLWAAGGDPWERMFELARTSARESGKNELWPYWLFEVEGGAKVERRVPMLPLSREHEQLRRLKRSLALYRLTFGQPRQEDLLAWLESQSENGALDAEQINKLGIRLEARGEWLAPNEDPELEVDVDAPAMSLRVGGSEIQVRAYAETEEALRAVARLYVVAFESIPNAETSRHWTLNQNRRSFRLNLGAPEVLTLYQGLLTLAVEGLDSGELAALREGGAELKTVPYDRLRRLAPRARWVEIPVGKIADCERVLARGLAGMLRLDTRTSSAPTRQYMSTDAVQTMGRLGGSAKWAEWQPTA